MNRPSADPLPILRYSTKITPSEYGVEGQWPPSGGSAVTPPPTEGSPRSRRSREELATELGEGSLGGSGWWAEGSTRVRELFVFEQNRRPRRYSRTFLPASHKADRTRNSERCVSSRATQFLPGPSQPCSCRFTCVIKCSRKIARRPSLLTLSLRGRRGHPLWVSG